MLQEFLIHERSAIVAKCEERIVTYGGPLSKKTPPTGGWTIFYDDLIEMLIKGEVKDFYASLMSEQGQASTYMKQYVHLGYSVADVVRSYEILSRSISELAEGAYVITPIEHLQLNLLLGTAITEALTEYESVKMRSKDEREVERLGFLAHELRNGLQAVVAAFDLIEAGSIGPNSNTSSSLQGSLSRMASLIDGALTEVRMRTETKVLLQSVNIIDILSEVMVTSNFQARKKDAILRIKGFDNVLVLADKQLSMSALSNIIQNAIKFSPRSSTIEISARIELEQIFIDVQDQCGGLPATVQEMLSPYSQHSHDRSGLGLGLSITVKAIERCGGKLHIKDLPGIGCIFTIELRRAGPNITSNA